MRWPMSDSSSPNAEAARLDSSQWTCIELHGDDRLEWLQGQATNDVRLLTPGKSLSFCLCEPTGGLLAVVDAWALEDRILMTTARELQQVVLDRVERMTIMEDVTATVSPRTLLSIQGVEAQRQLSELFELPAEEVGVAQLHGEEFFALRSRRTSAGGWDLWASPDLAVEISTQFPKMPSPDYEAERVVAGIPKWGHDMGPKTLPPELGTDFESRHISYQKGCYTGQEVLMRIHSRGHTNRTWVGLVSSSPIPVGATVERNGKPVGTVSSAAPSTLVGFAAATLRNEAAQEGEQVTIDGVEATVRQMPLLHSSGG
jgi:tRNA-modifying protein YgfZ